MTQYGVTALNKDQPLFAVCVLSWIICLTLNMAIWPLRSMTPSYYFSDVSGPVTNNFATLSIDHQLETLPKVIDRDVMRQGLVQRKAGKDHLRHLVPGFIHAPPIDAV